MPVPPNGFPPPGEPPTARSLPADAARMAQIMLPLFGGFFSNAVA